MRLVVIIPDINLLVYAYNRRAPRHEVARRWWQDSVNSSVEIGLPWAVAIGYLRIMTHPRVLQEPIGAAAALADIRSWLSRPNVNPIEPGPRHIDILENQLAAAGIAASLTTDAHLAALAIEYQAELQSNDADFARFPGLKWVNPVG